MSSLIARVFALLVLSSILVYSAAASTEETCDFKCGDGKCISTYWLCDNVKDCVDGSDEKACNYLHECGKDEFMCRSQECIKATTKCNGVQDCSDGSDELGCLEEDEIHLKSAEEFEHGMAHIEVTTTPAPIEKKVAPIRSVQRPQRNATLFFTNNDVSVHAVRITDSLSKPAEKKIMESVGDKDFITSMAFKKDRGELLFVTKRLGNRIQAIKSNGKVHEFASHDSEHFGRIAVDPLTENIYYAEDGFGIGVCNEDASTCVPLVGAASHDQHFHDLNLNPRRGTLFFVQTEGSSSIVKVVGMNGKSVRHVGTSTQVHAIALDADTETLYVANEDVVERINLRTMNHGDYASIRASAMAFHNGDLFYVQRDIPSLRVLDAHHEDKLITPLTGSSFALALVPDVEKPLHFVDPCLAANCREICVLTEGSIEPDALCLCKTCGQAVVVEAGRSAWNVLFIVILVLLLLTLVAFAVIIYFRLIPDLNDRFDNLFGTGHNTSNISVGFNNADLN